jgi:uncharacterized OsmC-like protein
VSTHESERVKIYCVYIAPNEELVQEHARLGGFPANHVAQDIHATFDISAPQATPEQLAALKEKTEQYCVVMRTLQGTPAIKSSWIVSQP